VSPQLADPIKGGEMIVLRVVPPRGSAISGGEMRIEDFDGASS